MVGDEQSFGSYRAGGLVLTELVDGAAITDLDFSKCPFWVQIHGLPVGKMSRSNAEIIGRRFGKLLAIEASTEEILLSRSFLRVKVEINVNLPLPKGFWLKRKPDKGRDLWISYKYEKLSDFCYACGRIGHENRSSRFAVKIDGELPIYVGPELRTGRARRLAIPIEEIRNQVDEAERRVENLLGRRSEFQVEESGACITEDRGLRVGSSFSHQDHPTSVGGRQPHPSIRISTNNCEQFRGMDPEVLGNPYRIIPLNIPQKSFCEDPLLSPGNIKDCGPSVQISTSLPRNQNPQIDPQEVTPHYFVTEPSDSPKSPTPYSPTQPTDNPNPFNSEILSPIPVLPQPLDSDPSLSKAQALISTYDPKPNPIKSQGLDVALTSVFNNLSIKRKAVDENADHERSKILRLCGPNPEPPKLKPNITRSPKKRTRAQRRTQSSPLIEENLSDVCIQQSYVSPGNSSNQITVELVDMEDNIPNLVSPFFDDKGPVAGPNQPPSQC